MSMPCSAAGSRPTARQLARCGRRPSPTSGKRASQACLRRAYAIELAADAGDRDRVLAEVEPGALVGRLRLEHAVARLLGAAGLGDDDGQRLVELPVEPRRARGRCRRDRCCRRSRRVMRSRARAERGGDELGPERRAADADDEQVREVAALAAHAPSCARRRRSCLMRASVSSISRRSSGVGASAGVAQPVVADHALLVGVGDGAALERVHGREGLLHRRLHPRRGSRR